LRLASGDRVSVVGADAASTQDGDCPTVCVTGRDPRVRDRVSRAGEDHDRDHYFFCFIAHELGAGQLGGS
jgi:hypothetical protein